MTKTEKQLYSYKQKKMVEELLASPEMQKKRQEYINIALKCFFCIAVDWMSRIEEMPKEKIEEFLAFAQEQMHFVEDYEDYFANMLVELEKETGIRIEVN